MSEELAAALDENRRFYESSSAAAHYASRCELQPAEAAVLALHRRQIAGRRILDLGVGGGRTTPFLLELSSNYIGADYSQEMINHCRYRYPNACFRVADARDLSCFPERSFDFVFFSHSGIDAMNHEGRLAILGEVRRVLSEGGMLAFSSHNRNFRIPKPWAPSHLALNPLRNPIRFGMRLASYPVGMINYVRRAHCIEMRDEYCVSVDSAFRYGLVHYRITAGAQKSQLERAGFDHISVFDTAGRRLAWSEADIGDVDPWLHYVCHRKA